MDILKITPQNYKLDILQPNGSPVGLTVELTNVNDQRVKSEQRRIIDKINHKRVRGKVPKTEENEADRLEYLASAIVGWDWAPDGSFGGEKLAVNRPNALKLLGVVWIADQIDEALAEEAHFFPK